MRGEIFVQTFSERPRAAAVNDTYLRKTGQNRVVEKFVHIGNGLVYRLSKQNNFSCRRCRSDMRLYSLRNLRFRFVLQIDAFIQIVGVGKYSHLVDFDFDFAVFTESRNNAACIHLFDENTFPDF